MKNLKLFLILAMAFTTISLLSSCGGDTTAEKASETATGKKAGPEYTSAYICPMHCKGSGSAKPGTCPVCKMDYVANKNAPKAHSHEGHNHDHSHDGHNHNHDHDGHNHDSDGEGEGDEFEGEGDEFEGEGDEFEGEGDESEGEGDESDDQDQND